MKLSNRSATRMLWPLSQWILSGYFCSPVAAENLLSNSTFQTSTNGTVPDYWDLDHPAQMRFPHFFQQFGLDPGTSAPVPKSHALKIINSESDFPFLYLLSYRSASLRPAGDYTFSVYVKGDRPGLRIVLAPYLEAVDKRRPLSNSLNTDWTRIAVTFRVSDTPQLDPVLVMPDRGTYWLAAPQLEAGTTATPYAPAPSDLHLNDISAARRSRAAASLAALPAAVQGAAAEGVTLVPEYNAYVGDRTARIRIGNRTSSDLSGTVHCESSRAAWAWTSAQTSVLRKSAEDIALPLDNPAPGKVDCVWVAPSQHASANASFDVLPIRSHVVRTDRWRHTLEVDGKGFLIRGVAFFGPPPADWYLADLAEHGVNTLVYYPSAKASGNEDFRELDALLHAAAAHRLKVIVGPAVMGNSDPTWPVRLQRYGDLIDHVRDNPAVLAWFFVDEPQAGVERDAELRSFYRTLHERDPYHPAFANWNSDDIPAAVGEQPHGGLDASDIYSTDCYPFMNESSSLERYTLRTVRMLETAGIHGKPGHSWLQLYGYIDAYREPTGDELRYMSYLNLLFGSGYSYWETKSNSQRTWAQLSQTDHEIEALSEDVLLRPDFLELRAPALEGNFLYAIWKRGPERILIVLHVGSGEEYVNLDLRETTHSPVSGMQDYFSSVATPLSGSTIRERFGSYEVKVYRIL